MGKPRGEHQKLALLPLLGRFGKVSNADSAQHMTPRAFYVGLCQPGSIDNNLGGACPMSGPFYISAIISI